MLWLTVCENEVDQGNGLVLAEWQLRLALTGGGFNVH